MEFFGFGRNNKKDLDRYDLPKTLEHKSLEKHFNREIEQSGSEYIIRDDKAFFKFRREGGYKGNVLSMENIKSYEKGQGTLLLSLLESWGRSNGIVRISAPYVDEAAEGFLDKMGFVKSKSSSSNLWYKELV